MAKREQRKNQDVRSSITGGLSGFLEGIQKLVEAAGKLKNAEGLNQAGEFSVPGLGEKGKGIFGFSIRTMGGGEGQGVKVQPFGNMHETKDGMAVEEDRQPVVDVLEEGDHVRVIAELPGVSQADITCQVNGDILTISTKGSRPYHAEVLLPGCVEKEAIQSSCNNGVLEVTFKKIPK